MRLTTAATAALGISALGGIRVNRRPARAMKAEWIDPSLLPDFEAEDLALRGYATAAEVATARERRGTLFLEAARRDPEIRAEIER